MSEGKPLWLHLVSIGVSAPTLFAVIFDDLSPLPASDFRAFSEGSSPFGRTKARPYVSLREIREIRVPKNPFCGFYVRLKNQFRGFRGFCVRLKILSVDSV